MNAARLAEIEALAEWLDEVATDSPLNVNDKAKVAAAAAAMPDLAAALREARELADELTRAARAFCREPYKSIAWQEALGSLSAALAAFDAAKETW